jgi:hypothetical protein
MTDEYDPLALALHTTTDAEAWADAFLHQLPDANVDRYTLITWFANAIEIGRAHGSSRDSVS